MSSRDKSSDWYTVFIEEVNKDKHEGDDKLLKESVKKMTDDDVNRPNQRDDGCTPLHYACSFTGKEHIVELLIQRGARVNLRTKRGETALIRACIAGELKIVQLLLATNANVNLSDKHGRTPLLYAIDRMHGSVVQLLLKKGADVNQANKKGITPLYAACCNGFKDDDGNYLASWLIHRGANTEQTNNNGGTPLHIASFKGNSEVVESLIKKGVNVKQADADGWTALHFASNFGQLDVAKLLVEKGGRYLVNARDKWGQTPEAVAKEQGQHKIVKYLHEAKGVTTQRNNILQNIARKVRASIKEKNSKTLSNLQEPVSFSNTNTHEADMEEHGETPPLNTQSFGMAPFATHHQSTNDHTSPSGQDGEIESLIQLERDSSSNDALTFGDERHGAKRSSNDGVALQPAVADEATTIGTTLGSNFTDNICLSNDELKQI